MANRPKIAMIGAGSVVFARHLLGDIMSWPECKQPHIALMDIDADRLMVAERMAQKVGAAVDAEPLVTAHKDRKPALDGADYVINTIQVGGFPATKLDFDIPEKYGLKQTIADTNGIGGIFRALRTMPVMVSIAKQMEQLCPQALFINYANPMAMVCWAVLKATKIQTVGLCHSVQGTAHMLARFMGIPPEELVYSAAGINHMNFYLKLEHKGRNVYPKLRKAFEKPEVWEKERVRGEVFRRLGYFVSESSEHFSEYVPWFIKSAHPELIERYGIPIREYIRRCEWSDKYWKQSKREMLSKKPLTVRRSYEYCANILHAHQTGEPTVVYGNVLNHGLITNIQQSCCVEVPCLVDKNGIQPCFVGDLPPQLAAPIRSTVNLHELVIEAFFTGRKDHVYHAAMMDPHAAAELTIDEIYAMCDELLAAHGKAIPKLK